MPGEAPGPLQVRATPKEKTPPAPGESGGYEPRAGGRARGSNKDRLQLGPARGPRPPGSRRGLRGRPGERRGLSYRPERDPEGRRSAPRGTR